MQSKWRGACVAVAFSGAILPIGWAYAQQAAEGDVPAHLSILIEPRQVADPRATADKAALALDASMLAIYDNALAVYKRGLLGKRAVIIALFTGGGGSMMLYAPGKPPLTAPQPPLGYQIAKSISHSAMAIYQLAAPYVTTAATDRSWVGPMRTYRAQLATAREALPDLGVPEKERAAYAAILDSGIDFLDACLARGGFGYADVEAFARSLMPHFKVTMAAATRLQVAHWTVVLEGWKRELGTQWDTAYAATNALYVTRQNNILFTVLAQAMGRQAIGERLFLFETTEFTTTADKMLDLLARIVADRSLGQAFFRNYYLMDAELLADPARDAIAREAERRGVKPDLPALAPFHSHAWPWRTDRRSGDGPVSLDAARD
jgi:hypothetical protein